MKRKSFFKEHRLLIPIVIALFIIGVFLVVYIPELPGPEILEKTYVLFGLALNSVILMFAIAFMLLFKYKKNKTALVWGLSFLAFSIPFIGLSLRALGFPWANDTTPFLFFIYRNPMILWVAGIYYGLSLMMTKLKRWQIMPTLLILLIGYLWFIYGLLIRKNIEYTMYGFLYFLFIPLCISLSYVFYKYGKREKNISMKMIALGFFMVGIIYMAWAPWHNNFFYYNCFFIFTLSLVPILMGISGLPFNKGLSKHSITRKR